MEGNKILISLKGILVPADWDENGNVIRIAIMTPNEEEYIIEDRTNWGDLRELVRKEVRVRGPIREEAGRKVIEVESYEQIR